MKPPIFKALLKGDLTKQEFMKLWIPAVIALVVAWAFARFTFNYPNDYEIESNFISNQGNPFKNPIGAWFFILSTSYMGVIFCFYFVFIYNHLKPTIKPISQLMLASGVIGGIGLVGVAIFPEINEPFEFVGRLHLISAIVAFGGLGFGAFLSIVLLSIKAYQKHNWPDRDHLAVLIIVISFFSLMLLPTQEATIRQWTGFYIIFIWANVLMLVIPDRIKG
jgi:hypothetical membrane protein